MEASEGPGSRVQGAVSRLAHRPTVPTTISRRWTTDDSECGIVHQAAAEGWRRPSNKRARITPAAQCRGFSPACGLGMLTSRNYRALSGPRSSRSASIASSQRRAALRSDPAGALNEGRAPPRTPHPPPSPVAALLSARHRATTSPRCGRDGGRLGQPELRRLACPMRASCPVQGRCQARSTSTRPPSQGSGGGRSGWRRLSARLWCSGPLSIASSTMRALCARRSRLPRVTRDHLLATACLRRNRFLRPSPRPSATPASLLGLAWSPQPHLPPPA